MDLSASLQADVDAQRLFAVVEDLTTYPRWLDIVGRAERQEPHAVDVGPAWSVDLRGQLGPLRRSKRLRMVRTRRESPTLVRFERAETDGRSHSDWVLTAEIRPSTSAGGATELVMSLHYGGSLWIPLLERVLSDEIVRSRPRLLAVLADDAGPEQA